MSAVNTVFEKLYAEPSRNGVYKSKEHHGQGVKIVNMGELFGFDFIGGQEMKRLKMSEEEMGRFGLVDGDLLFGRRSLVEAGAGKCSLVEGLDEPTTFESSIIRVRLNTSVADPGYYYYYFRSPQGRGRVRSLVTGANVKGIRGSDLKRLEVECPDLEVQRAIARTLRRYDDLIENNRRRIALLEEVARLLYREWFVYLRFPGHEHAEVVDGVPGGWTRQPASEVVDVLSGGTPKTGVREYWDGEIPFFTPKDAVPEPYVLTTEKHLTEEGLRRCNSRLFERDALFITARGTVGKLNLAQRPMAMNQSCYALKAREPLTQFFLYYALGAQLAAVQGQAGGAVFSAIVVDTFSRIPLVVPPERLVREFSDIAGLQLQQVDNLLRQNESLAAARDLLLPRLMSGEVRV